MEGSSRKGMVAMAVYCTVVLVLVAMAAGGAEAQCSLGQVNRCTNAVTRGTAPTVACCNQVGAIADFNCFCRMLQGQRNIPQAYIANAVRVPSKCGAKGSRLRNKVCGKIRVP